MLIKGSINYPGTEHSNTVSFIHSMKSNSYKAWNSWKITEDYSNIKQDYSKTKIEFVLNLFTLTFVTKDVSTMYY